MNLQVVNTGLSSLYTTISKGSTITPIKHIKQYMFELTECHDMTQQQKDTLSGMLNIVYMYLKSKNTYEAMQATNRCMAYVADMLS